ncbi:hypothetical protein GCM10023340_36460 [Nocardioides marinquilinus]|uniref:Uncharacterized protein n=1 Tax=Nocardioides marinquilinus TaxID=1210400 RepID=A0ABP9PXE4_9ACTN
MSAEYADVPDHTDEHPGEDIARLGKRGHDETGSVRPADGRYGLHDPGEESLYCGPEAPAVTTEDAPRTRKAGKR